MNYDGYAKGVLDGPIVSGELMRLACKRYFAFRIDPDFEFKKSKVDTVIAFFGILKHFVGEHANTNFVLSPWQEFVIACIYGFYRRSDGTRLTTSAYIEVGRKNGKSALAAGLCLYHLIADGEGGAEVYLAANSKDQVKRSSWPMCSNFAKGIDPKGDSLVVYRDMVRFDATKSRLEVLAADSSKLDGQNPSMYLLDEYHAAKTSNVKDVLQSGQGMRRNPMAIIITTAGFDKLSPCYEYRLMCEDVLRGFKQDDGLFAAIFSIDPNDSWKDPEAWIKSNPNMGVTVKKKYIAEQVQKAINSTSEEVGVRTKTINEWVDSSTVWMPHHYIVAATHDVDISALGDIECFAGIDLSSTSDLTAVSALFPNYDTGILSFKTWYYLPTSALSEKRFKEQYGAWHRNGYLTLTPGNVTDYDYILNDLINLHGKVYIRSIGYDQWNATQFVINATDKYLNMKPFSQTIGNFNRPTKELERLIKLGKIIVDNNPITRHCFANCHMKVDHYGNIKPTKEHEEKKIDGVISMITALGMYLESPNYKFEL